MNQEELTAVRERYITGDIPLGELARSYGAEADAILKAARAGEWKHRRTLARREARVRSEPLPADMVKARDLYVSGRKGLRQLAVELGRSYSEMKLYCRALGWAAMRRAYRRDHAADPAADASVSGSETAVPTGDGPGEDPQPECSVEQIPIAEWQQQRIAAVNQRMQDYVEAHRAQLDAAERDYVENRGSVENIAKKHGLCGARAVTYAGEHSWTEKRREYRKAHGQHLTGISCEPAVLERVRHAYVTGTCGCVELAEAYGISVSAIRYHVYEGGWKAEREAYRAQLRSKLQAAVRGDDAPPNEAPLPEENGAAIGEVQLKLPAFIRPEELDAVFAYIRGEGTYATVGKKYGVSRIWLRNVGNQYDLNGLRSRYLEAQNTLAVNKSLAMDVDMLLSVRACAVRSMDGINNTVEQLILKDDTTPAEWRDLMDVLLRFSRLHYVTSGELTPEARARHEEAMERIKAGQSSDAPSVIRVEWGEGMEEVAQ